MKILFVAFLAFAVAFKPSSNTRRLPVSSKHTLTMSPLETASTLVPAILRRVPPSEAQGAFLFFFFAGSGALGIGGAQIPKLLEAYKAIGDLAGGPRRDNVPIGRRKVWIHGRYPCCRR
jgi:hypothetical protein